MRSAGARSLDVVFQSKPALALEQIRAAHAAGVPPGVVLADEVYGSTAAFRQGVSALGLDYAAAVRATTPAAGQAARPSVAGRGAVGAGAACPARRGGRGAKAAGRS
jgi:SRSO17 transposase